MGLLGRVGFGSPVTDAVDKEAYTMALGDEHEREPHDFVKVDTRVKVRRINYF